MWSCGESAPYIVRLSDGIETIDDATRTELDAHLATCASCRADLETQRAVASVLRTRPPDRLSPAFSSRLAARLDEASGWFGIADWRAWTVRLAPVAAALALAAVLGGGAPGNGGGSERRDESVAARAATVEEFALGVAEGAAADPLLWRSDLTPEAVVESMVTGELPAGTGGAGDVR
jgi:anti-sigma factor RsiW